MRTAYSVYTSFLDRLSSCAPRRFRAWRRQYGQHRTEPYSRTEVARYRPIHQRDLRFDPEDPDAQVGPHGGPTATATRDAEMAEPSRSLQHRLIQSLLVTGRAGRPRFRARPQGQGYPCRQHEASRRPQASTGPNRRHTEQVRPRLAQGPVSRSVHNPDRLGGARATQPPPPLKLGR